MSVTAEAKTDAGLFPVYGHLGQGSFTSRGVSATGAMFAHPLSTSGIQAGFLNATVACSTCRPGLRPSFAKLIFAGVTCFMTTGSAAEVLSRPALPCSLTSGSRQTQIPDGVGRAICFTGQHARLHARLGGELETGLTIW